MLKVPAAMITSFLASAVPARNQFVIRKALGWGVMYQARQQRKKWLLDLHGRDSARLGTLLLSLSWCLV